MRLILFLLFPFTLYSQTYNVDTVVYTDGRHVVRQYEPTQIDIKDSVALVWTWDLGVEVYERVAPSVYQSEHVTLFVEPRRIHFVPLVGAEWFVEVE